MPIGVSVNVKKIDKERFYKGKKGLYLNLVLWETEGTEAEEYGEYIVKQQAEKGEKMPILGNGKIFKKKGGKGRSRDEHDQRRDDDDDEIPF